MKYLKEIEDIKNRVSIQDVMIKYGLYPVGGKTKYRCPFHGEDKNPSASITRGRFHCFTCGKSWDVISFVQEMEQQKSIGKAIRMVDSMFNLGLYKPLTEEELKKKREREKQLKREKQKKENLERFEKKVLSEIAAKMRSLEKVCYRYKINKQTYENYPHCDRNPFFKSFLELKRLEWLYDVICGFTHEDLEYDYTYGTDKVKLLRKIYKGEIKI